MPSKRKKFSFEEHWGQQLFRVKSNNKDFLWALVRKQYGEDDVERKGQGIYIGVEEKQIFDLITDRDPESATFGKRVPRTRIVYDTAGNPKEEPMPIEMRFKHVHEATPVNIRNYKKLVSYNTIFGNTQFYWVVNGRKIQCENQDDFFNLSIDEVKVQAIPEKVSIVPTSK